MDWLHRALHIVQASLSMGLEFGGRLSRGQRQFPLVAAIWNARERHPGPSARHNSLGSVVCRYPTASMVALV